MTKAEKQIVAELQENLRKMEARLKELESTTPSPPYQGGESIATPEDLIYILRTQGQEAYDAARKQRNRAMRERHRRLSTTPSPPNQGGELRQEAV